MWGVDRGVYGARSGVSPCAVSIDHVRSCRAVQRGSSQGHSVFEFNPDESQRLSWLGCQPAACRRDIRMARPPQQPNRGIAKRCHDLGDTATAHL